MHISLDGFVAGPNGEMDWININPEIFDHVEQRIGKTDTALYGRVTFQMMEAYWPEAGNKPAATKHDLEHSRWYKHSHKVVLSKTLNESDFTNTEVIRDHVAERLRNLQPARKDSSDEILLFGSPTATHSLLQQNLIDGYWLFVNPILLGRGIPLFNGLQGKTELNLLSTRQFSCGVTELNYTVKK